ncbi:purine-cytosine permease family protein [Pseudonocardia acaciae]|uniref:purine-cytosine permease family protein n=1 Tax=Pseudonocardia acaciae TaxID=551276 RepID=UPI000491FD89|nr:cytosine permease [Pseudonocardia acaciae]
MSRHIGADDFAAGRIPRERRHGWLSVAMQRFGTMSSLPLFLLGSTLGVGMTFWEAFWAFVCGSVVFELITILVGVLGVREGMSTSMIARWAGFGKGGASLIGLIIGISLIGWFGVQTQISAQGLTQLLGGLPEWAWSLVFGLVVTLIVVFGFNSMAWTAYLTVPPFVILVGWAIASTLTDHPLAALVASPAPGPAMSVAQGAGLVAGGTMLTAVITCDMTRFNRTVGDVVKQTVLGITLGEFFIGLSGVLLAHATRTENVVVIVLSAVGWIGVLVTVLSALKINDWNLYSASLGFVIFADAVFGRKVHRGAVALAMGVVGSVLAAANVIGSFATFLTLLGDTFSPVAGIMLAEYFVVRTWRDDLRQSGADETRAPGHAPVWVPASLLIWLASTLVGMFVPIGIGTVNALVLAFVLYVAAGRLGWVRGVGVAVTEGADRAPVS